MNQISYLQISLPFSAKNRHFLDNLSSNTIYLSSKSISYHEFRYDKYEFIINEKIQKIPSKIKQISKNFIYQYIIDEKNTKSIINQIYLKYISQNEVPNWDKIKFSIISNTEIIVKRNTNTVENNYDDSIDYTNQIEQLNEIIAQLKSELQTSKELQINSSQQKQYYEALFIQVKNILIVAKISKDQQLEFIKEIQSLGFSNCEELLNYLHD